MKLAIAIVLFSACGAPQRPGLTAPSPASVQEPSSPSPAQEAPRWDWQQAARDAQQRDDDARAAAEQQRQLEQTELQINDASQQMMQQSYDQAQQQLSDYASQVLAEPWPQP